MRLIGTKLKMGQIYKNEIVIPVTPVLIKGELKDVQLKEGDLVKVSGITKGHGFQGVVKRHGFAGGPKTHGQKNRLRMPGSIGNTTPQRVIPGRRMAGHMGVEKVTVKNLKIVKIEAENKKLFLKGAVPGNNGGKLVISY